MALQRKVRTEVFQLEDTLAQVKKEYEMLRIEFEQTLAANEQAGYRLGFWHTANMHHLCWKAIKVRLSPSSSHPHSLLFSQALSTGRCVI